MADCLLAVHCLLLASQPTIIVATLQSRLAVPNQNDGLANNKLSVTELLWGSGIFTAVLVSNALHVSSMCVCVTAIAPSSRPRRAAHSDRERYSPMLQPLLWAALRAGIVRVCVCGDLSRFAQCTHAYQHRHHQHPYKLDNFCASFSIWFNLSLEGKTSTLAMIVQYK